MPEALVGETIRWGPIGALVVASLAIRGSRGPATISLVAAGSAFGARRCLGYLLGIVLGTAIVLVAVATGITAALLALPAIRSVLIGLAAAYILWLAYHVATAPPLADASATVRVTFAGGALLGVANPKAWVAIAAVFAGSHLADAPGADATAKTIVLAAMIVVINVTWLGVGASLAPLLRDPRRARLVNVTLAVALVAATALAVVH